MADAGRAETSDAAKARKARIGATPRATRPRSRVSLGRITVRSLEDRLMRFVYVMDPMAGVLPDKDTTVAFLRASQARGHVSLHCLTRDLFYKDDDLFARVCPVKVSDKAPHYSLGDPFHVRLAEVDAVFIRKDPPFDRNYLYATLLLDQLRGRTLLLNDPRGIRDANEKLYSLHFARFTPKTLVTSDRARILAFVEELGGTAVIKPLDGAGGSGVLLIKQADQNRKAIVDLLTGEGRRLILISEYLPAVRQGDKRILLLDGEPLGAINRVPRPDDLRSNIHVGGIVEPTVVTAEERAVIEAIAPRLRQDGLYFVGLDMIGGKLTEVNVTSPTGIQELSSHIQRDVAIDVIAWVERRVDQLTPSPSSTQTS
jgi:glutathione synthase